MSELTTEELARLRLRLNDLSGFDALGLMVYTSDGRLRLATQHHGFDSSSEVSLAYARTADAAARWLAGRVRVEVGCTAPDWGWVDPALTWRLTAEHGTWDMPREMLPAEQSRARLPDGSLYAARLALALACRHAGRTP